MVTHPAAVFFREYADLNRVPLVVDPAACKVLSEYRGLFPPKH